MSNNLFGWESGLYVELLSSYHHAEFEFNWTILSCLNYRYQFAFINTAYFFPDSIIIIIHLDGNL